MTQEYNWVYAKLIRVNLLKYAEMINIVYWFKIGQDLTLVCVELNSVEKCKVNKRKRYCKQSK